MSTSASVGISCHVCGEHIGRVTEWPELSRWYPVWTPNSWDGALELPPTHTLNVSAQDLFKVHNVFECPGARGA